MAGEREVTTTLRFTERGIEVVDEAGRKLGFLRSKAEEVGKAGAAGFSSWQTSAISFNQTLDLVQRGYQAFVNITSAPIAASSEADRVVRGLNTQLQISGQYSDAYSQKLQAQATEQQKLTAVSDEAIIAAQQRLILFGATEASVFRATRAALDLANGDVAQLGGAVDALGQTMLGRVRSLRQFGVAIENTGTNAEKFGHALDAIESKVGGRAAAAALSYEGRINGLKLAFDDLLEPIGDTITKSTAVGEVIATTKGHIERITKSTADWVTANRGLIDEKLSSFFHRIETGLPSAATGMADLATNTVSFVDSLGPLFAFVAAHPQIAAGLFLGGKYGAVAGAAVEFYGDLKESKAAYANRGGMWGRENPEAQAQYDIQQNYGRYVPGFGALQFGSFDATAFAQSRTNTGALPTPTLLQDGPLLRPTLLDDADPTAKANAATAREAQQKAFDQQSQAAAQALNDLVAERLALFERDNTLRDNAVKYAEQDLSIAKDRGASESELIDLAGKVDAAQRVQLERQLAGLEAQRDGLIQLASLGLDQAAAMVKVEGAIDDTVTQLERQRAGVVAVNEAYQRQHDVVINLGEAANDAQRRVVDGILSGGGQGFDLSSILQDTVRTIGTDLIGGLVEANSKGGDLVVEGWGESMRGVQQIFKGTFENIISGVGQFTSTVTGLFGGAGAGAGSLVGGSSSIGTAVGTDQSGATIFQDQFGNQSLGNAGAGQAASTAGAAGAATGSAGLGYVGAIIAVAQVVSDVVKGVRGGLKDAQKLQWDRNASAGDFNAAFGGKADYLGGIWQGILGDRLGSKFSTNLLTGGMASILEAVGISPFGQPKTSGTITKKGLAGLLSDTGVPFQRLVEGGGREGIRVPFLETPLTQEDLARLQAAGFDKYGGTFQGSKPADAAAILARAQPGVRGLNTGPALGLGALLGEDEQQIFNITSALTNNFAALGVSEDEARRQMLKLAEAAGFNLVSALDELQKKYVEGDLTQKQFQSSAAAVVDLYSKDMPAGIDLAALAVKNFSEQGGLEVGAFTEAAERAITIFGRLQDTTQSGLGAGIQAGIVGFGNAQATRESYLQRTGASLGDVQQAITEAKEQFLEPFVTSIYDGVLTAMTDGILDAAKDSGTFKALEQAIVSTVGGAVDTNLLKDLLHQGAIGTTTFAQIVSGNPAAILSLTNDVLTNLGPSLEQAAAATQGIANVISVLPSSLRGDAGSIDAQIKSINYNELNRPNQLSFLRNELGDIDAQLAALSDGQGGYLDPGKARELLERRADIGSEFVSQAQSQYAFGTQARGSGVAFGVDILEDTSKMLHDFADEQSDALTGNTSAITENTAAITSLTANGITITLRDGGAGAGDDEAGPRRRARRHDGELDSAFWELFAAATQSERGSRLIRNVTTRP